MRTVRLVDGEPALTRK